MGAHSHGELCKSARSQGELSKLDSPETQEQRRMRYEFAKVHGGLGSDEYKALSAEFAMEASR